MCSTTACLQVACCTVIDLPCWAHAMCAVEWCWEEAACVQRRGLQLTYPAPSQLCLATRERCFAVANWVQSTCIGAVYMTSQVALSNVWQRWVLTHCTCTTDTSWGASSRPGKARHCNVCGVILLLQLLLRHLQDCHQFCPSSLRARKTNNELRIDGGWCALRGEVVALLRVLVQI